MTTLSNSGCPESEHIPFLKSMIYQFAVTSFFKLTLRIARATIKITPLVFSTAHFHRRYRDPKHESSTETDGSPTEDEALKEENITQMMAEESKRNMQDTLHDSLDTKGA